MEPFQLPAGFLFGSATASLQIEGGDKNNSWYRWCGMGKIKDGSSCLRACDHWNRVDEDIALMKELHHGCYRMGLEWSRIEPEPGVFSEKALEHYRDEIKKLTAAGIKPLVTLHHFSNPLWFEDSGAWTAANAPDIFNRYTEKVVSALGDLVTDWVTINEPNVYLFGGYIVGNWPPGKFSLGKAFRVMKIMARSHIKSYKTIHRVREERQHPGKTMVGVANHLRCFDPVGKSGVNRLLARLLEYFFQEALLTAMCTGRFNFPLGLGSMPEGEGRFADYLGVNYYSRDLVALKAPPMFPNPAGPHNDLGWELYPQGLDRICRKFYAVYNLPIWITENGTADARDAWRSRYIYDHLKVIHDLNRDGIPVERYYHWSLMDNFEWAEGESARFGLIELDYETQKRTVRQSGRFYAEISAAGGVTDDMVRRYLNEKA